MTERLTLSAVETDLGPMLLVTSSRGVVAVGRDLATVSADVRVRLPAAELVPGSHPLAAWLAAWTRGERRDLPPVDLRGLRPFDAAVYAAVRDVGWGERATYGDVAVAIGRPGAPRAVGSAMGRCPLFPAVPCHRVVRAADGWSGWGGDDGLKRRLLDRERQ
ncbi:MAG: methylated-DNA--[protein]-cysteine S-methyltransferase [Chloroflexota bacterium]